MPPFPTPDFCVFFLEARMCKYCTYFPPPDFYFFRREKNSKNPKCRKRYIACAYGGFAKEVFFGEKKTSFGVKRLYYSIKTVFFNTYYSLRGHPDPIVQRARPDLPDGASQTDPFSTPTPHAQVSRRALAWQAKLPQTTTTTTTTNNTTTTTTTTECYYYYYYLLLLGATTTTTTRCYNNNNDNNNNYY